MPRGDKTGPMGLGEMTGRGFGVCAARNVPQYGIGYKMGYGCRHGLSRDSFNRGYRGFGRYFSAGKFPSKNQDELLLEEKNRLNQRLEEINKQLGNL